MLRYSWSTDESCPPKKEKKGVRFESRHEREKDVTEILHNVVVLEVFQEFDFTFKRVEHTLFTFLVG